MLQFLHFKAGARPEASPLQLSPANVTVLVGPNNSGKSLALAEIFQFIHNPIAGAQTRRVLESIAFSPLNSIAIADVKAKFITPYATRPRPPGQFGSYYQIGSFNAHLDVGQLAELLGNPSRASEHFSEQYARHRTIRLDGAARLQLLAGTQAGQQSAPATSALQEMWRDKEKRKSWRDIVHRAFGFYPYIDPTNVGQLTVRISHLEPQELHERTFLDEAISFQQATFPIESYSDGVKAFVGMTMAIIAGDHELVLIDEPEAFLHPSLAFILGKELTRYLGEKEGEGARVRQLIVATHSPNFLVGCVQAKKHVDIVRLTYESGVGSARLLPAEELRLMMRRPILRSANALAGVFYHYATVGEADADRSFYQEINERLLEQGGGTGISNCLFMNANGKDPIVDLVKPLRKIGIPTAAIVDIDIFKQGGRPWKKFMDACNVPQADRPTFQAGRLLAHQLLSAKKEDYQIGGVSLLAGGDRESVQNVLSRLETYGLFVVPEGEVEFWLSQLEVARNKNWLHQIFEKLGDDPSSAQYVRPTDGDVWAFMGRVKAWLINPSRQGMTDYTEPEDGGGE